MSQGHRRLSRRRWLTVILPVVLLASLISLASVSAAVSVTPASGGAAISADTHSPGGSGAYTTLTGPTIAENIAGDIPTGGNIVLNVPAGFEFNAGSASATVGGTGCNGLTIGTVTTTTTTVTIPITGTSIIPCAITVTGLQVRPTAGTPLATGNILNTGTRAPTGSQNYGTLTEVPGAPLITFTSAPIASTTAASPLTPAPTFHSQDAWTNNRTGDSVQLAIKAGTGTTGAILTCATNPGSTNGSGNVTFTGCSIDKIGTGYVLTATTGAVSVDTNAFDITIGPPTKLVFTAFPATVTGPLLTPQPSVTVTDAGGNPQTGDNTTVITLAISSNPGSFTCTGGLTKMVTAGVATFSGCRQAEPGNYTLTATSVPVYTAATSPSFTIFSSDAAKLAFCWGTDVSCPSTAPVITSGTPFSVQPTIRVQNLGGTTVTSDNTTVVTLSIAPGSPTSGGPGTLTCDGGLSKTVTAGVATFSGCKIDKAGAGYRLNATSNPLTPAQSNAFNVTVGPPTRLAFIAQPPSTASSAVPFPGPVTVGIVDAGGTVVTNGITATIALSIGANPGSGTLTCTGGTSATTVNGVATFNGCTITGAGNGYTLIATATATTPTTTLAPATSATFNVSSTAVAAITLTTSPGLNSATPATAVIVWGHDVTFTVHFAGSGANRAVDLQVSKDQVAWSSIAALTTNASGEATFTYGPSDNRYYRATFAGSETAAAGVSPTVRVVVRSVVTMRPTNGGKVKRVAVGTVVVFTATARPNRPELPQAQVDFVVYALNATGWSKVFDQVVAVNRSTGKALLTVTFAGGGKYYVRSQLVPTPVNANSGWTPIERYDVG